MEQFRLIQLLEAIDNQKDFCAWCPAQEFCEDFFNEIEESDLADCPTVLGLWLDGN